MDSSRITQNLLKTDLKKSSNLSDFNLLGLNGMATRLRDWLLVRFSSSKNALLRKISKGLERDKEIPFRFLVRKAFIFFYSLITSPFNLRHCDKVGKRVRTRCRPHIENMGTIVIGNDVNINSRNVQTDLVTGPYGHLEIGNSTSINFGVSIVANKKIMIGERVRIGPYTMIYDSNMHVHGNRYERAPGDPVTIDDDVWLASRVMVMKGSRVGKGSIVAAGSVISGIIPPYVVAAGIPARIVKYMQPPEESGFMWENSKNSKAIDKDIFNRVCKVASDSFTMKADTIKSTDSHNTIEGWNAFRHVKFIRALENEFSIKFADKDWSRLTTIKKISRIVGKYLDTQYGLSKKAE